MSNAFREANTATFRNLVTFVTGFGVVADQPFNVGSSITTNSPLNVFNQLNPYGGISGFNITGIASTTSTGNSGRFLMSNSSGFFQVSGMDFRPDGGSGGFVSLGDENLLVNLSPFVYLQGDNRGISSIIGGSLTGSPQILTLQPSVKLGDWDGIIDGFYAWIDGSGSYFRMGYLGNDAATMYYNGTTLVLGDVTPTFGYGFDLRNHARISGKIDLYCSSGGGLNVLNSGNINLKSGNFNITGNINSTGNINIKGNVNITSGGLYINGVSITGGSGGTGSYSQSGAYIFATNVTSGVNQQFINFPASLGSNPVVLCNFNNISGTENIFVQASGIVSTGFWATYSKTIDRSGYSLHTIASISSSTGLATTVIVNNVTSSWSNLTWNSTIVWNCDTTAIEDKKIIVLTGNAELSISGLYNGWCGILETIQSGASSSGYSLTLPSGTKVVGGGSGVANLTRVSGAMDMLGFTYDGTKLFMNIGSNFN